jgi:spore germination protein GerM
MSRTRIRLVILGLVLIAGALVWRARSSREPVEVPDSTAADSTALGLRAVTLWFASDGADSLVAEAREMPETPGLHARIAALVAALEQGPRAGGTRTLPEGTQMLHAYLDDGGVLTLDLSRAFRQGFHGGARAEELTLGSLVRTLAANVPEAKRIRIVCAGVALPTLGGHFPLDQPLDPADWP